jgi:structure-specific recognition protein 1
MADARPTQFEGVFLNLSKHTGRLRLHPSGIGWKSSADTPTEPFTVPASDIRRAVWTTAARGHALRVVLRNGSSVALDGFAADAQERLFASMKVLFNVVVENREHSLRGWNWGKARFDGNELAFQVGARNAFEIPLGKVSNTNLVGKNEVAVEFAVPKEGENKEFELGDELVEIRFYVPGMKEKDKEGEDEEDEEDEDGEKDEDEEEDGDKEEVTAASVVPRLSALTSGLLRNNQGKSVPGRNLGRLDRLLCLPAPHHPPRPLRH